MTGFVSRLAGGLARVSSRYVPDSFTIAAILTLVTLGLALTVGGASPAQAMKAWGDGVFTLLALSMQIALVVFTGYVVAVSPPMRRLLDALASIPRSPRQAVAFAAAASMILAGSTGAWGSSRRPSSCGDASPGAIPTPTIDSSWPWHTSAGVRRGTPARRASVRFSSRHPTRSWSATGDPSAIPLSETIFTTWNECSFLVVFATREASPRGYTHRGVRS